MAGKRWPAEIKAAVLKDYRSEVGVAAIAAKYGVDASTVTRWANLAGVARRTYVPNDLKDGAWVYGNDGIARWEPGATPAPGSYVAESGEAVS